MMVGVVVALGFSGSLPCGALHPSFGRRGSDVGVMMRIVDACGPTGHACVVCVRSTLQG